MYEISVYIARPPCDYVNICLLYTSQMSEAQRRERKPEAAMQIVSLLEQLVSHE